MDVTEQNIKTVLEITEMIAKYGIPLISSVMATIKTSSPSIEEIHRLKKTIKNPEDYFKEVVEKK